jgi:hypothetical protein
MHRIDLPDYPIQILAARCTPLYRMFYFLVRGIGTKLQSRAFMTGLTAWFAAGFLSETVTITPLRLIDIGRWRARAVGTVGR